MVSRQPLIAAQWAGLENIMITFGITKGEIYSHFWDSVRISCDPNVKIPSGLRLEGAIWEKQCPKSDSHILVLS